MSDAADSDRLPTWAPRVPKALIRRFYETDAKGIYDEELIDEVGYALLARCQSFITANLARAGYDVLGYDLKHDALSRLVEAGGRAAESGEQVVLESDIVLSCVEGRDAIALADAVLLPHARPGRFLSRHDQVD